MNRVGTRSTASEFFEAQVSDAVERVPTQFMAPVHSRTRLDFISLFSVRQRRYKRDRLT